MNEHSQRWIKKQYSGFRDILSYISYQQINEIYRDGKLINANFVCIEAPKKLRMKEIKREGDVFTITSKRFKFNVFYWDNELERYAEISKIKVDLTNPWGRPDKLWLWR